MTVCDHALQAIITQAGIVCSLDDSPADALLPSLPNVYRCASAQIVDAQLGVNPTSRVLVGTNSFLRPEFTIKGARNVVALGANCRVRRLVLSIHGDGNAILIGRGVTCESATIICAADGQHVVIGDDCMISNAVVLRTDDGHGIFDLDTKELLNPPQSIVIGAQVWIGNSVRINKGARIGTGSVIGQMSIVSGEVEPNALYAGIPARKVRGNICWARTYEPPA
jgi:acetyltransferase-like isoleucine patch superfamily enzyme